MLIFVPMAGFGDRYIRAGFKDPKPLIPVDGKPMIERVISCFPGEEKFLFCVNKKHAEETRVVEVLNTLRPNAPVHVIEPHKDGPIQTLLDCAHLIQDDEEVVLNYCDFGVDWDYRAFKDWLAKGAWDGAMSAYKGFHPHSLGPTLYAYMRTDGDKVLQIQEKHHFTDDKFQEYASAGLYYFRRGETLKRIAKRMIESQERVNGEFYVSMAMQMLIADGGNVGVYPLRHFYQWGTPEDLRDYNAWAKAMRDWGTFAEVAKNAHSASVQVIPMAGLGQRFSSQGYKDPKPLIPVAGKPMIARALACLPTPTKRVLVAMVEHAKNPAFQSVVRELPGETSVVQLDRVTEGQANTAELGLRDIEKATPVLFAPCDTGYIYNLNAWLQMESSEEWDAVAFTAIGHLPAHWRPTMYGWCRVVRGEIREVSVKELIADLPPSEQEVLTGTFWFRDVATFEREMRSMMAANDRVKNEFYIDTMIRRMVKAGARVGAFTVEKYIPWGTPEELKTFDYWNDVFRHGETLGGP